MKGKLRLGCLFVVDVVVVVVVVVVVAVLFCFEYLAPWKKELRK